MQVTYLADLFLDKNKDFVVPEHQALLNTSPCAFIASMVSPLPEGSSKSSKFSSIGTRFKVMALRLAFFTLFEKYASYSTLKV